MAPVVHMIVEGGIDAVRMRCGKVVSHPVPSSPGHIYDAAGNEFGCTILVRRVTCKKCINLLTEGTIHAKRSTPKRTAPHARPGAPRAARTHARARTG